jgi:hypothetical protein
MRSYRIRRWIVPLALGLTASAGPAAAHGWSACLIRQGMLLVPARAAGLTGLFVLDAAAPRSQVDATQASLAGLEGPTAVVVAALAGVRRADLPVDILPLDARTRTAPVPVTGVLGLDVLKGRVLEVRPDPCRFRLSRRAPAPARPLARLRLVWRDGIPLVPAAASDGLRAAAGLFAIGTGLPVGVQMSPTAARMEGAPPGAKALTAPLRALSLGDLLVENPLAAVADPPTPGALGAIGEPVWTRYALTLDLVRNRLTLSKP